MSLLLSPLSIQPHISESILFAIRSVYGFLLLLTLLMCVPQWKRFFISEKWSGYAQSGPLINALQSPSGAVVVATIWILLAISLFLDQYVLIASFLNLLLCRYFFVDMRWKGVLRGMGAPGLMSYWLGAAVFVIECARNLAPSLVPLTVLVFQIDFAFIMLSAGIYKATAGYAVNEGMEYGLANPEWGYWWTYYKKLKPHSYVFKTMNHLAWATEVVAGIMMLFPPTRFIGGAVMLLSFVFIRTQIRLGVLCEIVMLSCFLFFNPGSVGDQAVVQLLKFYPVMPHSSLGTEHGSIRGILSSALLCYLILMPLAHAGLFYNFYGKKRLRPIFQFALERFTNFFGIIIWRVFSVDVVNFFILIFRKDQKSGKRILISRYGRRNSLRFNHVAESITITSLFTTLKYYASNKSLFDQRILRYAHTLPCLEGEVLEFDYVRIRKQPKNFSFKTIARFVVDPRTQSIEQINFTGGESLSAAHAASPVHEGYKPGSYAPAIKG